MRLMRSTQFSHETTYTEYRIYILPDVWGRMDVYFFFRRYALRSKRGVGPTIGRKKERKEKGVCQINPGGRGVLFLNTSIVLGGRCRWDVGIRCSPGALPGDLATVMVKDEIFLAEGDVDFESPGSG